jgi:pimeloyl-ACP methyl ester carboxylesterase
MTTSTIRCANGDIAVHQSGGSGLPLVLIHGNSASSRAFERQLNSPLGDRRRLIAIDLPGHGQSADAASPAHYGIAPYGRMITEVARQLGVDHGLFIGWSLGGHAVLEASADLPKAAGFCIFGTPPLPFPPRLTGAFLDHPAMRFTFAETVTTQDAPAFIAASFKPGFTDIPPAFVEDVLRTDGRARAQLINPDGEPFRDEVRIVATLAQPLAVLHGADEQLVSLDYFKTLTMPTLWRGAVQVIDDAGHAPQWEQPERFNALLDAFASELE